MIEYLLENFNKNLKFTLIVSIGYLLVFIYQFLTQSYYTFALLCYLITAILLLLKPKKGVLVFIFFAIINDDSFQYGYTLFRSIYRGGLGPFDFIDLLIFQMIVSSALLIFLKGKSQFKINHWDKSLLIITAILIVWSIIGLGFGNQKNNILTDFKNLAIFIIPYFFIRINLEKPIEIYQGFRIFFLTLASKTIVTFFIYLAGFAIVTNDKILVRQTSDVVFYIFLFLFSIAAIYNKKNTKNFIFFAFIALVSLFCLILSFGREAWFWSLGSIILLLIIVDKEIKINMKKYFLAITTITILIIIIIFPTAPSIFWKNVTTFSIRTKIVNGDYSGTVRAIEWINIINKLKDNYALLWGLGIGATWTDNYHPLPFKRDLTSFPINETEHRYTHMAQSKFLLKLGVLGSLFLWGSLLTAWILSFRYVKIVYDPDRFFFLIILASLIGPFAKIDIYRICVINSILLGLFSMYLQRKILDEEKEIL